MRTLNIIILLAIYIFLAYFLIPQSVGNLIVENNQQIIEKQLEINQLPTYTTNQQFTRNVEQNRLNSEKSGKMMSMRFILIIASKILLPLVGLYLLSLYNKIKRKSCSSKKKQNKVLQQTKRCQKKALSKAKYYFNLAKNEASLQHEWASEEARRNFEYFNEETLKLSRIMQEQQRLFDDTVRAHNNELEMQRFMDESLKTVTPFEMGGYEQNSAVSYDNDFGNDNCGFGNDGGGFDNF